MKGPLLSPIEKALIAGTFALVFTGSTFFTKYLDKITQEENCEKYGFLKGQSKELQRAYIVKDLAKDNIGYRENSFFAFDPSVIDYTVHLIIKDINKCQ